MKTKHTIEQLQLFLSLFELQAQFEELNKGWILDHNSHVFGQVYIDQKRQLISNIDCPYGLIDTKVDLDSDMTMFPFRIQRKVGEQLDGKLFSNPTKPGSLKIDGFSIEANKQEEKINQIQIFAQGNYFTYQNYVTGEQIVFSPISNFNSEDGITFLAKKREAFYIVTTSSKSQKITDVSVYLCDTRTKVPSDQMKTSIDFNTSIWTQLYQATRTIYPHFDEQIEFNISYYDTNGVNIVRRALTQIAFPNLSQEQVNCFYGKTMSKKI